MSSSGKLTVLVVEDEPSIRLVLRLMLEHLGCLIVEAADGPPALELMRTMRFDLALIDHQLPSFDGTALCHFLVERRPHTRVVLCSGSPEALVEGPDGISHLPKPYGLAEVTALIDGLRAERWPVIQRHRRLFQIAAVG